MKIGKRIATVCVFLLSASMLLLTGCQEYDVHVKVNPDGSGSRHVELKTTTIEQDSSRPAYEEFVKLFNLEEKQGWTVKKRNMGVMEIPKDQFSGYVYTLQRDAKDLTGWADMSNDINIRAALPDGEFQDVRFYNTIELETGHGTGVKSYTYRETFVWESLKEELVAFHADYFVDSIATVYPKVGAEDLAELKGLMTGHLSIGFDKIEEEGEIDGEEVARSLVPIAAGIIRRTYPDVDEGAVWGITEAILSDETNNFERWAQEKMPGIELAVFATVKLHVTMPGEIVESNADEVDGQTAVWELEIMRAASNPIELFVRSELRE